MNANTYDDDENVAHLQFGDEFFATKIQSLSNDEIYCVLNRQIGKITTEAFDQTKAYVEKLVTTKAPETVSTLATEIRKQLEGLQLRKRGLSDAARASLHHFEISSLSNLISDEECEIEEVLSWIPSLSRFEDDDVITAVSIVKEAKERVGLQI